MSDIPNSLPDEGEFTPDDNRYMSIALREAEAALELGDYPVGAALVVDGELWGKARNALFTSGHTTAHAEHALLYENSYRLRQRVYGEKESPTIYLYTTLEPCLMCLGTSVLHRVSKIIVACPDPDGGTTAINPAELGNVYARRWPEIAIGLRKNESCALIINFLRLAKFQNWERMLHAFEQMRSDW